MNNSYHLAPNAKNSYHSVRTQEADCKECAFILNGLGHRCGGILLGPQPEHRKVAEKFPFRAGALLLPSHCRVALRGETLRVKTDLLKIRSPVVLFLFKMIIPISVTMATDINRGPRRVIFFDYCLVIAEEQIDLSRSLFILAQ